MYESSPRPTEGKPIEEVLPAAINATATSEQQGSRQGGELARRYAGSSETRMAVMSAGSPLRRITELPAPLLIASAFVLAALVVLAIIVL